jgi:hypothetical protein
LSSRITVPSDEWNKVRKDIEQIKTVIKTSETREHEKSPELSDFSEVEKAVLRFIGDRPGATKQGVVDGLNKLYSRVPVFRTINLLVGYGMVVERKDKTNRQKYNLFINSENLLVSLVKDFDDFEKAYEQLLNEATVQFSQQGSLRKSYKKDYKDQLKQRPDEKKVLDEWYWETAERKIQGMEESILFGLLSVYNAFIFLHIFIALFRWPLATQDSVTLTKLYAVFFTRVRQLHLRIIDVIPSVFGRRRDLYFVATRAAKAMQIESLFEGLARSVGVDSNFTSLIDSIWKNIYDFLTWSKGRDKEELKDWRAVFEF